MKKAISFFEIAFFLVSEPGAARGAQAGSPLGVVDAIGISAPLEG